MLNFGNGSTVLNQRTRERVAEAVELHVPQPRRFQRRLESKFEHLTAMKRLATRGRECQLAGPAR